MKVKHFAVIVLTLAMAWFTSGLSAVGKEPAIWLCGEDNFERLRKFNETSCDYLYLFEPAAPWQSASKHLSVFKVDNGFVLKSSDDVLKTVFADLQRRHIALALEAGLLSGHDGCGVGVEGFAAPLTYRVVAERIHNLGGRLDYLAMDEPLWYGFHYQGKNACHMTMTEIATEIAAKLKEMRTIFPDLRLGDIEPTGVANFDDWNRQIIEWTEVYQKVVGEPLAFFHADIDWKGPWKRSVPELDRALTARQIPFGIIYDGFGTSDQEWTHRALENAVYFEDVLHVQPADAIIQSWVEYPRHFLPETQPYTLTNLVDLYAASRTKIQLNHAGGVISGRLLDDSNAPLANAVLLLRTSGATSAAKGGLQHASGVVPAGAVKATFGLRIMANYSSTPTTIRVGQMRFLDKDRKTVVAMQLPIQKNRMTADGKIIIPALQKFAPNAGNFPVFAGHSFDFSVPFATSAGMQCDGFIAVVFLDGNGKQIGYVPIDLKYQPGENARELAKTQTAADGTFSFSTSDFNRTFDEPCYVYFAGGFQHRMARTADFRLN